MKYHFSIDLGFTAGSGPEASDTSESFDVFTGRVIDELFNLEAVMDDVGDPDVAGRLADRTMSIGMIVEARTPEDGAQSFLNTVRTALHAAGGETSNWPAFRPIQDPTVSRVERTSA